MTTILHLIPTLEGGGAERQLSLLAAEQVRRGYDVHIALRRGGVHAQSLLDGGARLHRLGDRPSVDPRQYFAIVGVVSQLRPDVVQTWLPQMDVIGGLAALQSRTAWVISERTSSKFYADVPYFAWVRRQIGRYSSAVVANSEAGAAYWRLTGGLPKCVAIIRNALDLVGIRTAPAKSRQGLSGDVVLVVGRFSPEKALEIVVQAIGNLEGVDPLTVVMIGEGPVRGAIEEQIKTASLCSRISIQPYQSDWWSWLKIADCLVVMSRFEGNPNVVLEAMAAGCPVILSDISAHREIADSSSALFVPVDDVNALSNGIAELLLNKGAASERARRAQSNMDRLTVQAMADAYDAVYSDALNGKK